jgi:hypothetical protein
VTLVWGELRLFGLGRLHGPRPTASAGLAGTVGWGWTEGCRVTPLLGFLGFRGFSLGNGVLMRYAARQAQEVGLPTVGVVASYERGCSAVMKIDVWPVKCSEDSPIKST